MKLTMRPYENEEDYWRIRAFLRRVFLFNGRRELGWQAYRFDYWRWHGIENLGHGSLEEGVFLWETAGGELAAVLHGEAPGDAFLQLHPELCLPYLAGDLQAEMLAAAERHLAVPRKDGRRKLWVWTHEEDAKRHDVLARRGYTKTAVQEYARYRALGGEGAAPIPEAPVAEGYSVRALGGGEEHAARSWLSWRAFHPDDPDEAYEGWDWYANIQRAPLYRRDLDLVAVAPDGSLASFCTIWFDDVTRCAAFEPVGTAPEYQRLGLGKAVMSEGLRRARKLGATRAFVGSYTVPAHALYASVGFTDYELVVPWEIVL
jgi:GNAT superfamily N-acetyltransferase